MAHKKGHKSKSSSVRPPSKSSERIARLGVRAATSKRKDDDFVPAVRGPGTKAVGKPTGKVYENKAKKRFAANKAANAPKPDHSAAQAAAVPRTKSKSSSVSLPKPASKPARSKAKGSSPSGIAQVSAPSKPAQKESKKGDTRPLSSEKFMSGYKAIVSGAKNVVKAFGERKKSVQRANEYVSADRKAKATASLTRKAVAPSGDFDAGHTGTNKVAANPAKVKAAKSPGANATTPKPSAPKAAAPLNTNTSGGKKKVPTGVGYDRMGPSARSASKPTAYKDDAKASRSAATANLSDGGIEDKFGAAMSKIFGSYEAASGVEGTDSYKTKKYNKGKRTK